MGAKTKSLVIGGFVAVGLITSMQSLDDELAPTFAAVASSEQVNPHRDAAAAAPEEPIAALSQDTVSARGSTMLEQAILDAFAASSSGSVARNRASNAKDFVEASINSQGYLCADAVEMRQAAPGQYGIGCVMNRDGTGAAIYLVDARTGSVTEI